MQHDWTHEFPHRAGLVHLNHAGVAPWPQSTARAVAEFADDNVRHGTEHISKWEQIESELRQACQQLIQAEDTGDIALVKNTSEGLSIVAYGIPWQSHDNIVFASQEFPSNRVLWQSLQSRFGVEARCADLYQSREPEDALFNEVDRHTRLISVSAVQYDTGLRMDLGKISDFCKSRKILLCVDAIQALGATPFDLASTPADFVMADSHKWLLGPEGIGLFYCNPEVRDQLHLNQFGWHMLENSSDFESREWKPAADARRFECGSLSYLGIHAMHASLKLLFDTGITNIHHMISSNISYIYEKSMEKGLNVISSMDRVRRSGILTLQRPGIDNRELFRFLLNSGVLCAYRCKGIRFSPHFYTNRDDIDCALELTCDYV